MSPVSDSDFVPFEAPDKLLVCPLLHWMVQVMGLPSGSLIGILQVKLNGFPVELFVGEGIPNVGGVFVTFPFVVNMYHLRVYCPQPVGSVALTQIL